MSDTNKLINLLVNLQDSDEVRRQSVETQVLAPQLGLLRAWQAQRLERTYTDLLADKQYAAACRFFLSDIYAARDFSQRDHDAERLHDLLSRYLPAYMLSLLADTIQLNQMTKQLDQALLHALVDELGVTDTISAGQYAQGYRICNNYAERLLQIERIVAILDEACLGARHALTGISLKLVRVPAQRAGWGELYDFLLRGYTASQPMRKVQYFTGAIRQRETQILDRIFANHPDPFGIDFDTD